MEATKFSKGVLVFTSRGLGKFVEIDRVSGMAKVEIKTRTGTQVFNEFANHLKSIKFNAGDRVVRSRPHRGQKLEGKVTGIIDHEQFNVQWDGSLQPVTVMVSELLSQKEYRDRRPRCLHI
jgi:hypothetical protein